MIFSIDGQLVNAYIEPQFTDVAGNPIVTVEFDAWESVPNLRKHIRGELRTNRVSRYWNFTGYMPLLDFKFLVENLQLSKDVLRIEFDTSPEPVAYSWIGWESDVDLGNDEYVGGETWYGHALPEDVDSIRYDSDVYYECFYAYPLFTMPKELTNYAESSK
jgi:hypothetical protein